ncbi:hypothetical protein GCM10010371_50870 [Streptomyces subrutilus]|uniref:Uncharacterized protein n=1 Tax=Streptomyces subrutilus TaxID=36818 RepID=A0A918R3P8_9ACTN|nr:hypothetical protein GCM10010371_50870 [Streptomyces subrutilus]
MQGRTRGRRRGSGPPDAPARTAPDAPCGTAPGAPCGTAPGRPRRRDRQLEPHPPPPPQEEDDPPQDEEDPQEDEEPQDEWECECDDPLSPAHQLPPPPPPSLLPPPRPRPRPEKPLLNERNAIVMTKATISTNTSTSRIPTKTNVMSVPLSDAPVLPGGGPPRPRARGIPSGRPGQSTLEQVQSFPAGWRP